MVDAAPDQRERVGMAEGDEPANDAETATHRSLAQRMAAIRAEASGVGKEAIRMVKGDKSWTIQAHTIEGVLHGVRTLLDKHGVWMEMSLVERSYSGNRCDALFAFRFECLDSPEQYRVIQYAGAGTDNSDKAFAKAGTNALKEMLKKTFLITDREDAREEEDRVEHEAEGASRAQLEAAQEKARRAVEKWATNFREALLNAPDIKTVDRLQRENKDELRGEHTPAVTRSFFIDLIETRKRELA